jgi:hypothetical protein
MIIIITNINLVSAAYPNWTAMNITLGFNGGDVYDGFEEASINTSFWAGFSTGFEHNSSFSNHGENSVAYVNAGDATLRTCGDGSCGFTPRPINNWTLCSWQYHFEFPSSSVNYVMFQMDGNSGLGADSSFTNWGYRDGGIPIVDSGVPLVLNNWTMACWHLKDDADTSEVYISYDNGTSFIFLGDSPTDTNHVHYYIGMNGKAGTDFLMDDIVAFVGNVSDIIMLSEAVADSTPPVIENSGVNDTTPKINDYVNFSMFATDAGDGMSTTFFSLANSTSAWNITCSISGICNLILQIGEGQTETLTAVPHANDTAGNMQVGSKISLNIEDSPPTTPSQPTINPIIYFTNDVLTLSVTGETSIDPDNDAILYIKRWLDSDSVTVLQENSSSTFSCAASGCNAGDTISVKIIATTLTQTVNSSDSTASSTITISNSNPDLTAQSPIDDIAVNHNTNNNFSIFYNDLDNDIGSGVHYINISGVWTASSSNSSVISGNTVIFISNQTLTDGESYDWMINFTDGTDINSSDIFTMRVDLTTPDLTWTYPLEDNSTKATDIRALDINVVDTFNLDTCQLEVRDNSNNLIYRNITTNIDSTTFTFQDTVSNLTQGNNTFTAQCNDTATASPFFGKYKAHKRITNVDYNDTDDNTDFTVSYSLINPGNTEFSLEISDLSFNLLSDGKHIEEGFCLSMADGFKIRKRYTSNNGLNMRIVMNSNLAGHLLIGNKYVHHQKDADEGIIVTIYYDGDDIIVDLSRPSYNGNFCTNSSISGEVNSVTETSIINFDNQTPLIQIFSSFWINSTHSVSTFNDTTLFSVEKLNFTIVVHDENLPEISSLVSSWNLPSFSSEDLCEGSVNTSKGQIGNTDTSCKVWLTFINGTNTTTMFDSAFVDDGVNYTVEIINSTTIKVQLLIDEHYKPLDKLEPFFNTEFNETFFVDTTNILCKKLDINIPSDYVTLLFDWRSQPDSHNFGTQSWLCNESKWADEDTILTSSNCILFGQTYDNSNFLNGGFKARNELNNQSSIGLGNLSNGLFCIRGENPQDTFPQMGLDNSTAACLAINQSFYSTDTGQSFSTTCPMKTTQHVQWLFNQQFIQLNATVNDSLGNRVTSDIVQTQTGLFGIDNHRPGDCLITDPVSGIIIGQRTVNISIPVDGEGNTLLKNITIYNSDDSFNQTLYSNLSINNRSVILNTTAFGNGDYKLGCISFENASTERLSSDLFLSQALTINNIDFDVVSLNVTPGVRHTNDTLNCSLLYIGELENNTFNFSWNNNSGTIIESNSINCNNNTVCQFPITLNNTVINFDQEWSCMANYSVNGVSSTNITTFTISNIVPNITEVIPGSLANLTFNISEGSTVLFNITNFTDLEDEDHFFTWILDGIVKAITRAYNWITDFSEVIGGTFETRNVTAIINDSSNNQDLVQWLINVFDVPAAPQITNLSVSPNNISWNNEQFSIRCYVVDEELSNDSLDVIFDYRFPDNSTWTNASLTTPFYNEAEGYWQSNLTVPPLNTYIGLYDIRCRVFDNNSGDSGYTSDNDAVNVFDTQVPPYVPNILTPETGTYSYSIPVSCGYGNLSDENGDDITFFIEGNFTNQSNLSTGFSEILINSTTGSFDWLISNFPAQTGVDLRCRTFDGLNYSSYFNPSGTLTFADLNYILLTDTGFRTNLSKQTDTLIPYLLTCKLDNDDQNFIDVIYADCNGDGIWDYAKEYFNFSLKKIGMSFNCIYDRADTHQISAGCVIRKESNESWASDICMIPDKFNKCNLQKVFEVKVE